MKPRILLVHWNRPEARARAARLERAGYAVDVLAESGKELRAMVRKRVPAGIVIDLGRLPSHGRQAALWLRENRTTRRVPLVFVAGDAEKTERVRKAFPDAEVATWRGIRGALRRALASPPADPVVPSRPDYSGTPLPKKLGIREGMTVALLGGPAGFRKTLGSLPADVRVKSRAGGACGVIVLFARSIAELRRRFPAAKRSIGEGGGLWVAWPKKASGVATDLDQQTVQDVGLAAGLVDNKICAIDATWSGLRFMRRRR